jgi:hypothetical protein
MSEDIAELGIMRGVHHDEADEGQEHAGDGVERAFAEVVGGVNEHKESESATVMGLLAV